MCFTIKKQEGKIQIRKNYLIILYGIIFKMDGKLIYSKRFEKISFDKDFEVPYVKKSEAEIKEFVARLFEKAENESTFEEVPQWVEKAERAVRIAKIASHKHKIDIDIKKTQCEYIVTFYIQYMTIAGDLKDAFSVLYYLSSDVLINPCEKGSEYSYSVVLTYQTHRHFVSGREIGFE